MSGAALSPAGRYWIMASLLALSDAVAAILLAADLLVVCGSVLLRFLFNAPVEWADDVARGLMVGSSFFGAAINTDRPAVARAFMTAYQPEVGLKHPAHKRPDVRCSRVDRLVR